MKKYIVWGRMPLGSGYLRIIEGKRVWDQGEFQLFTADEIDEVLDKIGPEWTWKCYAINFEGKFYTNELYKQHKAQYAYV